MAQFRRAGVCRCGLASKRTVIKRTPTPCVAATDWIAPRLAAPLGAHRSAVFHWNLSKLSPKAGRSLIRSGVFACGTRIYRRLRESRVEACHSRFSMRMLCPGGATSNRTRAKRQCSASYQRCLRATTNRKLQIVAACLASSWVRVAHYFNQSERARIHDAAIFSATARPFASTSRTISQMVEIASAPIPVPVGRTRTRFVSRSVSGRSRPACGK